MVTVNVVRRLDNKRPIRVHLIERREAVGRGVAYGTEHPRHFLNVRATNMSALPDEPGHFVRWLETHQPFENWQPASKDIGEAYAPRRVFGRYVQDLLKSSLASAPDSFEFNQVHDEAIGVDLAGPLAAVHLRSGAVVPADRVVLALGNLPPRDIPAVSEAFLHSPRYVRDPWSNHALAGLEPDEPVLFVGAGLTMVDLAISLYTGGHRGPIHAVSRRGLVPQAHRPAPAIEGPIACGPHSVSTLLRLIRTEARDSRNQGWRSVINSLRAATPAIWRQLPLAEQRRFLSHVQTYWDLHRHRMSPETAALVHEMKASGQLVVRAGRIVEAQDKGNKLEFLIRDRRTQREVKTTAGRVINCTGATLDTQHLRHDLLRQLLHAGHVRPDALGMGLDVDSDGCCIDHKGDRSNTIYALGPLLKGTLWETTAVPEIRSQAAQMSLRVLESCSSQ